MRERILQGPPYSPEERERILTYCGSDITRDGRPVAQATAGARLQSRYSAALGRVCRGIRCDGAPRHPSRYGDRPATAGQACMGVRARCGRARDRCAIRRLHPRTKPANGTSASRGSRHSALASVSIGRDWSPASLICAARLSKACARLPGAGSAAPAATRPRQDAARSSSRSVATAEIARCCGRSPRRHLARNRRRRGGYSRRRCGCALLIKPEPGRAIAYIDWSSMEFQVAAVLSECQPMLELLRHRQPVRRIC